MSLMKLINDGGQDVACPHCGDTFSAEWDTEYGDPLPGIGDLHTCPNCDKEFFVDTDVRVTYTTKKV